MAQIYTGECERNVVRDCNNLFVVLKNLNVPSPRNDAESLKYLYKINTLLSSKQSAKLLPAAQFSIKYICNHPLLPTVLADIIKNSRNLKITTYSTEILFRLIIKNKLVSENERKTIRKLFWDAQNFKKILDCIHTLYFLCKEDTSNFFDLLVKVIKIINCCYTKKGITQISLVSNINVSFIGDLLSEYNSQKDLLQVLLPLIRVLVRNKKNVNSLASHQFFNSLCLLIPTLTKIATVVFILKLMTKTPEAVETMSRSEKIYAFILDTLNAQNEKLIYKKHLMGVLYKITKTRPGIEIITKPSFWNVLLEFVTKNDRQEELRMRLILIKGYTILHRGVNKINYQIKPVNIEINLPKEYKKEVDFDYFDESDNENDESDDEDVFNSPKIREQSVEKAYTSEEDFDFSDVDDLSSENEINEENYCEEEKRESHDVASTKKYFQEFFKNYSQTTGLRIFKNLEDIDDSEEIIKTILNRVKRYEKIDDLAFPDSVGAEDEMEESINPIINHFTSETLIRKLRRTKYFEGSLPRKVVYDLDNLFQTNCDKIDAPNLDAFRGEIMNNDSNTIKLDCISKIKPSKSIVPTLRFESRFESGNLRKVEQIGGTEYNLFLTPDVNTHSGLQWFYFQISNMQKDTKYTFNIINFQKANSQFNYGMQPVLFSCLDFIINNVGWKKIGKEIIYYGNEYKNSDEKQYRTLSLSLYFPYENDYCYLAYHYPYTYSRLMVRIYPYTLSNKRTIYSRVDKLCLTVNGANDVPLITITASGNIENIPPIEERPLVFMTARVHPSESNSSWIMDGILQFLLDEHNGAACAAREKYVFKIVPMLNPEGVIFGNTRYGLTGNDLNRCWKKPHESLHPEVYHAKKLVQFAKEQFRNDVFAFVDIHGHSRKKFFFFYGCNAKQSWNDNDKLLDDSSDNGYLLLPKLLSTNPHMKSSFCRYTIERKRESTCRVVMWREFNIKRSYTLECSYCCGENKKKITTKILRDIGVSIITSLAGLPQLNEKK